MVAQRYVDDPLLIDGLKFDLRLYVVLAGVNPLRVFLYEDGLARFATNPYVSAQRGDIGDLFTHLTNYSINKTSANFCAARNGEPDDQIEVEEPLQHKRTFQQVLRVIQKQGRDVTELKRRIEDLVVKTMTTGQNYLSQVYSTLHPDNAENEQCFQVLGLDVLIDSKLKPWLLEINQSPSFHTDGRVDHQVKTKLLEDTFALLCLSGERKQVYLKEMERHHYQRLMAPYSKAKGGADEMAEKERE